MKRSETLKEAFALIRHSEGGWFREVYTSAFRYDESRASAGSIYFLLDAEEVSHFHQIDCDEIWFYHEGCGMKITVLCDNAINEYFLGPDIENGQNFFVTIPSGAIFAAENLDKEGFTFVSCVTTPKFRYEGFRLVDKSEIKAKYPDNYQEIEYLAYLTSQGS